MTNIAKCAKYGLLVAIAFFTVLTVAPGITKAQNVSCDCGNGQTAFATTEQGCAQSCGALGGTPTTPGGVTGSGSSVTASQLENPLAICPKGTDGQKCVQLVIGNVIKAALGIVGSIALLMMVWGGFLWLTSMGNSDKVEKGKNTLIWATLGLTVIFGAYALTSFVITSIAGGGK